MKLIFNKIDIHNFMSFADETFDFSDYPGLTLVKGKNNDINGSRNGVGKSVTFEAILFALFGQLQEKIKNENIVNRYSSNNDMQLTLEFSVDECKYKIIRGLQKGKSSFFNLYRIEETNEIDITKSSIAETQEYLEKDIIHCDISIFLRTVLLTADQTYNFYKLKKADKKDFVEKLFDISAFGDMHSLIHKDVLALDKDLLARQNRLIVLNKNESEYENRKTNYESSKDAALADLTAQLSLAQAEYDKLRKTTIESDDEMVEKYTAALTRIDDAITENEQKSRKLERELNTLDRDLSKFTTLKDTKLKFIDGHNELKNKLCDDCQHVFSAYYNLTVLNSEVEALSKKCTELYDSKTSIEQKISSISSLTNEYKNKRKKALDKINELTAASNNLVKNIAAAENKVQMLKANIERKMLETNPYIELLTENTKTLKDETESLKKLETRYNYLKFAENIVSQETLRKLIIKDLIVLLNNRVKTYLTKLGAKYYVKFDEDMDYEFITEGGTCEFGNFSAGERMRTMIATSFAFRDFMSIRNGLNSNILILDEYFDSAIDSLCVTSILDILKDYNKLMKQNIFVISHRTEVSDDEFNNIMQVEKTSNISHISKIR